MSGSPPSSKAPPAPRLAAEPFFEGMHGTVLDSLQAEARQRDFEADTVVAREGDPATEFHLIRHGKVALEVVAHDRPRLTVLTLGPGEVFGWSWLAPPYRWRVDARAVKPTRTWSVPGEVLLRAFEGHPEDGYRFLLRLVPVLASRLDATWLQVLDVHRP